MTRLRGSTISLNATDDKKKLKTPCADTSQIKDDVHHIVKTRTLERVNRSNNMLRIFDIRSKEKRRYRGITTGAFAFPTLCLEPPIPWRNLKLEEKKLEKKTRFMEDL